MREDLTEVVDLEHVTVHLNTVFAPDLNLLHLCLVEIASYRALAQMGNQVGSLSCLFLSLLIRHLLQQAVENGALPHCCELSTCRAHLN